MDGGLGGGMEVLHGRKNDLRWLEGARVVRPRGKRKVKGKEKEKIASNEV